MQVFLCYDPRMYYSGSQIGLKQQLISCLFCLLFLMSSSLSATSQMQEHHSECEQTSIEMSHAIHDMGSLEMPSDHSSSQHEATTHDCCEKDKSCDDLCRIACASAMATLDTAQVSESLVEPLALPFPHLDRYQSPINERDKPPI